MWVDEAGYTKESLFKKVLVPILEMATTALIMISTLVDAWNYLTLLMNLVDPKTNLSVFNVFAQTLICDMCMESDHPEECRHKLHEIPPYKSAAKLDLVRLIYGSDVQTLTKESMGVIGETGGEIFARKYLKRLKEKEFLHWDMGSCPRPQYVFVGCDPNAGGDNETAVIAVANYNGTKVIVGLETWNVDQETADANFEHFIRCIRKHEWLSRAWIIYMGESNTGDIAARHANILRKYPKTHSVKDSANRKDPGVWTDKYRKRDYKIAMQQALCHDSVQFLSDFIVFDDVPEGPALRRTSMQNKLIEQASRARPTVAHNQTDQTPGFQSWSAKLDADGKFDPTANDDVILVICLVFYWMNRFMIQAIETIDFDLFASSAG